MMARRVKLKVSRDLINFTLPREKRY
jgi:hypothetical protein